MAETEKKGLIHIRYLQKEDLSKIVHWNSDPEINIFFDGNYPIDLNDAEHLFHEERKRKTHRKSIGDLELVDIRWQKKEAEIRIRIGEKGYWNKGYGTEAIRKILSKAFQEMGLQRIYLRVYDFNLRAIRCYEKCGFRKVGILKRSRPNLRQKAWKNIILMGISKFTWLKIVNHNNNCN